LEDRRNALLSQQTEVLQQMQQYSNQLLDLNARIDEVTATIRSLTDDLQWQKEEEDELRRKHREQMLAKRREVEEGRAKARQWYEERERQRKKG
jgi:hypothetical protein